MLLWCRVNASGFVMLRAWYHFFFFLKRFSSCTVTEKKRSSWSRHISVGSPLCALPAVRAVCLVSVCPHGSLDSYITGHCPCFLCAAGEVKDWARGGWLILFFLLRCNRPACGTVAVSLPLCFWLLTVSFHWRLHVGSVFVFSYPLMHLAWAVSLYVP